MNEGRIVDQGRHCVLMDRNEQYSHLIKTSLHDDEGNGVNNEDQSTNASNLFPIRFNLLKKLYTSNFNVNNIFVTFTVQKSVSRLPRKKLIFQSIRKMKYH